MEQSLTQVKGVKRSEVDDIKTTVESYKESMSELASRMEAMERALKDSLTPMMQSLRSLSETVKVSKEK